MVSIRVVRIAKINKLQYVHHTAEKLLLNMMKYVTENLTIEDFDRMCLKLKLSAEQVEGVTSDKSRTEQDQLKLLFQIWRKRSVTICLNIIEAFI